MDGLIAVTGATGVVGGQVAELWTSTAPRSRPPWRPGRGSSTCWYLSGHPDALDHLKG